MPKKNKRNDFLSFVPNDAKTILDVGCGTGGLGAILSQRGVDVVGIERDEGLCAKAGEKLSRVFTADIEKFDLPYSKGYFDCVIYADVLEHLVEPLELLKKHKDCLSDNGCVVASIPNIRYYKLINRLLMSGVWDYSDSGILDKTHLRFFTLINIKELFEDAGYEIIEIGRNIAASRAMKLLNLLSLGKLKELITYQYYIKAVKLKGGKPDSVNRIKYKL